MPDPDPQPPQPRAFSPACWLLMLTPSVLAIGAPFIGWAVRWLRIYRSYGFDTTPELLCLAIAILLCFLLGFRLEKWRWGAASDWLRAVGYGLGILFLNAFISFSGCGIMLLIANSSSHARA